MKFCLYKLFILQSEFVTILLYILTIFVLKKYTPVVYMYFPYIPTYVYIIFVSILWWHPCWLQCSVNSIALLEWFTIFNKFVESLCGINEYNLTFKSIWFFSGSFNTNTPICIMFRRSFDKLRNCTFFYTFNYLGFL